MDDGQGDAKILPDAWFYEEIRGNVTRGGYRAFEPPDPAKLPKKYLGDHGLFQRLMVTQRDLGHARSAHTFISEMIEKTDGYGQEEWRRICCYETTLVTSYARPFSDSRGGYPKLSFNSLGVSLSPFTKGLHQRLIDARNRVFAHSDIDNMNFADPKFMAVRQQLSGQRRTVFFPATFQESLLLSEEDIQRARVLVDSLLWAVSRQLQEMHTRFLDQYETLDLELGDD